MNNLRNLFNRLQQQDASSQKISYLVAGLGNPGPKYDKTRHNAGFMALDCLAQRWQIQVNKSKFHSQSGNGLIGQNRCLLLKPQTFMNNSGEAIEEARAYYKLSVEQMIVFVDDIHFPIGKIRIRKKGSSGGHNGIKSVLYETGEEEFVRIKIGVGQKPPEYDMVKWVLKKFTPDELQRLETGLTDAVDAVEEILQNGVESAMNCFNGR